MTLYDLDLDTFGPPEVTVTVKLGGKTVENRGRLPAGLAVLVVTMYAVKEALERVADARMVFEDPNVDDEVRERAVEIIDAAIGELRKLERELEERIMKGVEAWAVELVKEALAKLREKEKG